MTEAALDNLTTRIRNSLGCSKELAQQYARDMGDKPEIQNGQILVRNEDRRIIARLPASVLNKE
jgi:hypothetical protein